MATSTAKTAEEYLASLPPERREAISAVREAILAHLPVGYEEMMDFGMICYVIPLSRVPKTYNGHPLPLAALASQKNYMSVYLMNVYGDPSTEEWFHATYKATGKKLDMGKSCVRFKRLEDLPLDVIGQVIARTPVEDYIKTHERARGKKK